MSWWNDLDDRDDTEFVEIPAGVFDDVREKLLACEMAFNELRETLERMIEEG